MLLSLCQNECVDARIAKEFFLIALKIEKDDQQLNSVMSLFSSRLTAMMNGDEGLNIIAAPDQDENPKV